MHPSSVLPSRILSRLGGAKLSPEGPQKLCLPPSRDLPVPGRACAPSVEHADKGRLSHTSFPRTAPHPGLLHLGREEQRQRTSPRPTLSDHILEPGA